MCTEVSELKGMSMHLIALAAGHGKRLPLFLHLSIEYTGIHHACDQLKLVTWLIIALSGDRIVR